MRTLTRSSFVLLGFVMACSKREPDDTRPANPPALAERAAEDTRPAEADALSSRTSSAASSDTETAAGSARQPAANSPSGIVSETPPESFAAGAKESIENAVGLGCEAKSASGWLELLCHKRNGTGGHPVNATLDDGPSAGTTITPTEREELRLVLPWRDGNDQNVTLAWSDTRYVLRVRGASAKLEWAVATTEHRHACAKLLDASKAVLAAAQKPGAEHPPTKPDLVKLPRFGTCYPAGLGSWAVALRGLEATGEGLGRTVHLELEIVRIREDGSDLRAPLGTVDAAPGGFTLSALQVYDYDDDGHDEAIVGHELLAVPAGAKPATLPAVWSFTNDTVIPYARTPELGSGGVAAEHLDFDRRPDLGGYGPFVAWLGPDCGAKDCPPRVTGPRIFAHSLATGDFAANDEATLAALAKACPKASAPIVALVGGKLNTAQTAKNVGCARARGVETESLKAALAAHRAEICGGAESCPLLGVFDSWVTAGSSESALAQSGR